MSSIDFSSLSDDDSLLTELPHSVWLMDNHKWAFLAWERHRAHTNDAPYTLIHADYHWDGVDDLAWDGEARQRLAHAGLAELEAMTSEDRFIGYDSFIAPAVRRGTVSEVHFFCRQDDGSDEGIAGDMCSELGVSQTLHDDADSLAAVKPGRPLIFDLCLDLFNRSDDWEDGDLWSDDEVIQFLDTVSHHIKNAVVVTISISFGYSGTAEDSRHLAELVVPRVVAMRA